MQFREMGSPRAEARGTIQVPVATTRLKTMAKLRGGRRKQAKGKEKHAKVTFTRLISRDIFGDGGGSLSNLIGFSTLECFRRK